MSSRPQQQQSIDRATHPRPTMRAIPQSASIGAPERAYKTIETFIAYVEQWPQPKIEISIAEQETAFVRIVTRVVPHHMQPERGLFGWKVNLINSKIPHTDETTLYSLYWRCKLSFPQHDQRNRDIPMETEYVELNGIPYNLTDTHNIRVKVNVGLITIENYELLASRRAVRNRWRSVVENVFLGLCHHLGNQAGWTADTIYEMSDVELMAAVEFHPCVFDLRKFGETGMTKH